jgi:hypothetical protein
MLNKKKIYFLNTVNLSLKVRLNSQPIGIKISKHSCQPLMKMYMRNFLISSWTSGTFYYMSKVGHDSIKSVRKYKGRLLFDA